MESDARGHAGSGSHRTTGDRAESPVRCRQRNGDNDSQQVAHRPAADVGRSHSKFHTGVHSQVESTGTQG